MEELFLDRSLSDSLKVSDLLEEKGHSPKRYFTNKYVHQVFLLLSPILGWLYIPGMLWAYFRGYGTARVLSERGRIDPLYVIVTFTMFYLVAPLPILLNILLETSISTISTATEEDQRTEFFTKYGTLGSMFCMLLWLCNLIWRYRSPLEGPECLWQQQSNYKPRMRLDKIHIYPIRHNLPDGKGYHYLRTAGDLYDYLVVEMRHRWTILLVTVCTIFNAVFIKRNDTDTWSLVWWASLVYWMGFFFVFDSVCIGVIMRFDSVRVILTRFNQLTNKKTQDPNSVYLNISERLDPNLISLPDVHHERNHSPPGTERRTHIPMEKMEQMFEATARTPLQPLGTKLPDYTEPSSVMGTNVLQDNFEAWLRLRETLVNEMARPDALFYSMFLPTCRVCLGGLFLSLIYVAVEVIVPKDSAREVFDNLIYQVVGTTAIFTIAIFYIASRLGILCKDQTRSIIDLEFFIQSKIEFIERQDTTSRQLAELKSFYRLVRAARKFLQASTKSTQPRVVGLNLDEWQWVGVIGLVIALNGLFVLASLMDPKRSQYLNQNKTNATLPDFCYTLFDEKKKR